MGRHLLLNSFFRIYFVFLVHNIKYQVQRDLHIRPPPRLMFVKMKTGQPAVKVVLLKVVSLVKCIILNL